MIKSMMVTGVVLMMLVVAGCGTGPDAPTGLTVTSTSPITLSWTAVSGATSYTVYRGTTSGGLATKTLLASDITVTTYTDTLASAGTAYYYQVTAVSSDGVSSPSNEVNAVSQSQSGGLFNLQGSKNGSQITLIWNTVGSAASYNVYRGTTSSLITNKTKVANVVAVTSPTTIFTDGSGFTSGVTYFYQVTSVDSSGTEQSQASNEVSVLF